MARKQAGTARGGRGAPAKGADSSKELNTYFTKCYGQRWAQTLYPALLAEVQHVALSNTFTSWQPSEESELEIAFQQEAACIRCYRRGPSVPPSSPYEPPGLDRESILRTHYWLDFASVLPALLLQAGPGMATLDMCAAPGGKSLLAAMQMWAAQRAAGQAPRPLQAHPIMTDGSGSSTGSSRRSSSDGAAGLGSTLGASLQLAGGSGSTSGAPAQALEGPSAGGAASAAGGVLQPSTAAAASPAGGAAAAPRHHFSHGGVLLGLLQGSGRLVCNEPDAARRARLSKVLDEYLPARYRQQVQVTGHMADRYWGRNEREAFDRVLLDAPCSSDRHVLQQAAARRGVIARTEWSLKGCGQTADLQLQLLLAGLRALKPGGRLVYSTCSLAPIENDEVVARALARLPQGSVVVLQPGSSSGSTLAPAAASTTGMAGGAAGRAAGPVQSAAQALLPPLPAHCDSFSVGDLAQLFGAERTQHGLLCCPDKIGYGPIYVAVLHKVASFPDLRQGMVRAQLLQQEEGSDEGSGHEQ